MNEMLILILAGAAGGGLGAIFFGGLWWTIRRGIASPRPALWFLGSALLRTAIALAGFYFVSSGEWQRLTACLVGFIAARLAVLRLTRPRQGSRPATAKARPLTPFIQPPERPKNNMIIQLNTDHTIHSRASLTAEVEAAVRSVLSHHHDRIARVEVHLTDENGGKTGGNDIRCLMEARPAGLPPVAVTHHASELVQAVDGAAQKLKSALDHTLGKLQQHQS